MMTPEMAIPQAQSAKALKALRIGTSPQALRQEARTRPHGLYVSDTAEWGPGTVSPHIDAGGPTTQFSLYNRNALDVDPITVRHARGRGMEIPASAGVSALKKLAPTEFDTLMTLDRPALQQLLEQRFPGPDYSKYHDSYELLEALAGQMGRENGYDILRLRDTAMPEFSEMAVLSPRSIIRRSITEK
jgi:hypothetical protein